MEDQNHSLQNSKQWKNHILMPKVLSHTIVF
jgi:hypothetical protein